MAEDSIWHRLADCLQSNIPAVLVVVVESAGSSPAKAGAKLAVAADGHASGTVGGGAIEHALIEAAGKLLAQPSASSGLLSFHHDGEGSGMVCGGSQTVALLACKQDELNAVLAIQEARRFGQTGRLRISPAGLKFLPSQAHTPLRCFSREGEDWCYEESLEPGHCAYLVGGGHVSLALSQILSMLDFRVAVLEQREGVETFIINAHAHEKKQVDYAAIAKEIPDGEDHYAVIMTHAHTLDELVLRQLLGKRLGYLGMLGSGRKTAAIMAKLRQEFPDSLLAQVRAPVGLPIGSHTPAEIAVSIAAEMVAVRNGLKPVLGINPTDV